LISTSAKAPTTDTEKIKVRDSIKNKIRFIKRYLLPLGQGDYTGIENEYQRIKRTSGASGITIAYPSNKKATIVPMCNVCLSLRDDKYFSIIRF
jgi:hypothetical protein